MNVGRWAKSEVWSGDPGRWQLTYEWTEPRDIHKVEIQFGHKPLKPETIRVSYWQNTWPTPNPERRKGARRSWIEQDDHWHGQWVKVRAQNGLNENRVNVCFDPLDIVELPDLHDSAEDYNSRFRRTLKIRIEFLTQEKPSLAEVSILNEAAAQEQHAILTFTDRDAFRDIEIVNGEISEVKENKTSLSLSYMMARGSKAQGDQTLVTVHTDKRTFTYLAQDLEEGPIKIPDYGIAIQKPNDNLPLETGGQSVYQRVFSEPEQTCGRAATEIPHLDVTKQAPYGRYVILGWEGVRQEFALRYNGEIFANKRQVKMTGRDAAKVLWAADEIHFRFGSGDPVDFRQRKNGSIQRMLEPQLPVYVTEWVDREIEYTQTAFGFLKEGPVTGPQKVSGDEELIAAVRFRIRNTTDGTKRALLWMDVNPSEQLAMIGENIFAQGRVIPSETVKEGWKIQPYDEARLRVSIQKPNKGEFKVVSLPHTVKTKSMEWETVYHLHFGENLPDIPVPASIQSAVLYEVELAEYETTEVVLMIPFSTYTNEKDITVINKFLFQEKLNETKAHWQAFYDRSAKLIVPEKTISDFVKAVPWHVLLTADRDSYNRNYIVPAATYSYGACGNEACMQIRMLDMLGYHDYARAYLETFLNTQGLKGLDGAFATKEGVFTSVDFDEGELKTSRFNYNLDHGFIMTALVDHYSITGDAEWFSSIADQLISACDFIIRERERTENGLLPAGHLEDNQEWQQWFAVNAHAHMGMRRAVEGLKEINHTEAGRISEELYTYGRDIEDALQHAIEYAPVVRLQDGLYVPHVPTRTGIRGREWGWFREAAYGSLHLSACKVINENDKKTTWLLKDLEDNLFMSRQFGRAVDKQKYWFSQGGVAIQSNLLDNGLVYLRRDEIKHAVRALYNNFCQNIYRDVYVFTEHPVIELGHGLGPFFKTPDESEFLIWLRNYLLREEGQNLWIGQGIPREWLEEGKEIIAENMPTNFGKITFSIRSAVSSAKIIVRIRLQTNKDLSGIKLRLRHPQEACIQSFSVEGAGGALFDGETIFLEEFSEEIEIIASF